MAGITKQAKRYLLRIKAFEIIQENEPIRANEIVKRLWQEQGIKTSPAKLGKALMPFIRDDQLAKVTKNDGRYYSIGNQRLMPIDL